MLRFIDAPSHLILHCGANDLGDAPLYEVRVLAKQTINYLKRVMPNTKIIWSQALPRRNWRYSNDNVAMNKSRNRLNNFAATICLRALGGYIKYPDLALSHETLWSTDGVHLSDTGNDVFLNTIQAALEAIIISGMNVYPTN